MSKDTLDKKDELRSLCDRIAELEARNMQLQDSEERLLILFENAPDAYYLNDRKGVFVDGNAAAEALIGYPRNELIGKSFLDLNLISLRDVPRAATILARNMAGQSVGPEEFLLHRRDGTQRHVEIRTQPVKIGGKSLVLGLARDITERGKAIRELQASEAKFRSIVESSPMGIHMYELLTDRSLIFSSGNHAADLVLGLDNSQFIGKTIEEAFPPLAETEIPDRYRRVAELGESWFTEQIAYEDKMISGAFEVHAFQTEPGKMAAMFLDVTERKQAEERDRKHYENTKLLSETAIKFVDFPANEDIYKYIGERVRDFAGESVVVVNSISENGDVLTNRVILGLGEFAARVADLMGRNPRGIIVNAHDSDLSYLSDRKLHDSGRSLYAILQKKIPKSICAALRKLYNIGKIYTMGLSRGEDLFGTVLIFLSKEHVLLAPESVEAFINQASVALQRWQAEVKMQQKVAELAAINKIGLAVGANIGLDAVLTTIHNQVGILIDASDFRIRLYDAKAGTLQTVFKMQDGQRQEIGPKHPFRQGRSERIVQSAEPLFLTNMTPEKYREMDIATNSPVHSYVGVPMISSGEVIGVLSVRRKKRGDTLDRNQLSVLTAIASQAAASMETLAFLNRHSRRSLIARRRKKRS